MLKTVIPAIMAVALTACGGGGSGSTGSTTSEEFALGAVYPSTMSPMVLGKFTDSTTQYLVQAHLQYLGSGRTGPAPVKIYKLNSDGTMSDSTVQILGGATTLSTGVALVADFNHDGIDDLFLPGFSDTQELLPSVAFISRPGQNHIRVDLPDPVWVHGATVFDVNRDGHLDVMTSSGEVWFNDGTGSFTFQSHHYNDVPGMWIHGSGVCTGDFNNTGNKQLVLVDQMIDSSIGPIADTVIFELDNRGRPTAQHYLPVPVLDRTSTIKELSHDVACSVADLNNDGLLDIVVFSRPLPNAGQSWPNQGQVQVLINRGAWQFDDVTDTALPDYNTNGIVSYTALLLDLNGDGKVDLWSGYFNFGSGSANQVFVNNGSAKFTSVMKSTIASLNASGGMLPVKFGDKWAFVIARIGNGSSNLYLTKPVYTFN